ncbi:MAG: response regulator transcription factor [Lachnospiraceae bacterium]|nr:response regulator transcription factor [Lachnospiraceae bacterium]
MFVLFLPGYKRGESMSEYAAQLAGCAMFASYIQTFILLFIVLSTQITPEQLPKEAALSCRPLLYGICLWMILSGDTPKTRNRAEQTPSDMPRSETPQENTEIMATDAYEIYRRLGLTNREAELALLICKGLSNAEIAAELCISETTVKKHISNIFEKLQISKREEILKFIYNPQSNG